MVCNDIPKRIPALAYYYVPGKMSFNSPLIGNMTLFCILNSIYFLHEDSLVYTYHFVFPSCILVPVDQ
jgi:hypothetical protein